MIEGAGKFKFMNQRQIAFLISDIQIVGGCYLIFGTMGCGVASLSLGILTYIAAIAAGSGK